MGKNKWIEEVMDSGKGIQKAEAPAFFTEKVMQRIESGKPEASGTRMNMGKWALSFTVLMIALNLIVIQKNYTANSEAKIQDTNNEYAHSVIYTY